jgi:hypothetical protein
MASEVWPDALNLVVAALGGGTHRSVADVEDLRAETGFTDERPNQSVRETSGRSRRSRMLPGTRRWSRMIQGRSSGVGILAGR